MVNVFTEASPGEPQKTERTWMSLDKGHYFIESHNVSRSLENEDMAGHVFRVLCSLS